MTVPCLTRQVNWLVGEVTHQATMQFDTHRIIDSNGQKYRVGWDEHGWFSIQMITLHPLHDGAEEQHDGDDNVIEYDGETCVVVDGDAPVHSFSPAGTDQLIEAIRRGR
jgi:predicted metal-dependent enzyme (double-stranded beta helix superfamily)